MSVETIELLKDDLLNEHWLQRYNWVGVSIGTVAYQYDCSMDAVRSTMLEIQDEHPKPNIEFFKPCTSCGRSLGFVRTEKGKWMPLNRDDYQPHWITCPGADKHRKREK